MVYLGLNDIRFDNLLSASERTWLPQNAFVQNAFAMPQKKFIFEKIRKIRKITKNFRLTLKCVCKYNTFNVMYKTVFKFI